MVVNLIAPTHVKGFAALTKRFHMGGTFKGEGGILRSKLDFTAGTRVKLIATTAIEEHKLRASPYGSANVKVTDHRRSVTTTA